MAMQVPIAPWIPKDVGSQEAEMYATGVKTGAAIAADRARLQQAAAEHAMQAQMAAARIAQETALQHERLEQARREKESELAVRQAYNNAMVSLRDRDLAQKQQKALLDEQKAARLWAAQQRFGSMMQQGGKLEDALYQNPELLSPGIMTAMAKNQAAAKTYGKPIVEPVPGLKDTMMVYREGSPGVHIARNQREYGSLTPMQQATIERDIGRLLISKSNFAPGDPELDLVDKQISNLRNILKSGAQAPVPIPPPATRTGTNPPPAAQPSRPSATAMRYPEGTVLKNKAGKRYVVANGQLVPYNPQSSEEQYPEER